MDQRTLHALAQEQAGLCAENAAADGCGAAVGARMERIKEIENILALSGSLDKTLQQRKSTHGEFTDNASIMQELKDAIRARPGYAKLDATKREALEMILHKIGRIVTGNPEEPDHWHDIAGYATLARDRVAK